MPPSLALGALRSGTRALHARSEAALGADAPLTDTSYRQFLAVMLGLFEPAEDALAAWKVPTAVPAGWSLRPRAAAAHDDLVRLGEDPDGVARADLPPVTSTGEALGLSYVLEGSVLGAAVMRRRLDAELPHHPTRFLDSGRPDRWAPFLQTLEDQLGDPTATAAAVATACSTFESIEVLAQQAASEEGR